MRESAVQKTLDDWARQATVSMKLANLQSICFATTDKDENPTEHLRIVCDGVWSQDWRETEVFLDAGTGLTSLPLKVEFQFVSQEVFHALGASIGTLRSSVDLSERGPPDKFDGVFLTTYLPRELYARFRGLDASARVVVRLNDLRPTEVERKKAWDQAHQKALPVLQCSLVEPIRASPSTTDSSPPPIDNFSRIAESLDRVVVALEMLRQWQPWIIGAVAALLTAVLMRS